MPSRHSKLLHVVCYSRSPLVLLEMAEHSVVQEVPTLPESPAAGSLVTNDQVDSRKTKDEIAKFIALGATYTTTVEALHSATNGKQVFSEEHKKLVDLRDFIGNLERGRDEEYNNYKKRALHANKAWYNAITELLYDLGYYMKKAEEQQLWLALRNIANVFSYTDWSAGLKQEVLNKVCDGRMMGYLNKFGATFEVFEQEAIEGRESSLAEYKETAEEKEDRERLMRQYSAVLWYKFLLKGTDEELDKQILEYLSRIDSIGEIPDEDYFRARWNIWQDKSELWTSQSELVSSYPSSPSGASGAEGPTPRSRDKESRSGQATSARRSGL